MTTAYPPTNWRELLWETRKWLGLSGHDPVPLEELRMQARVHGYTSTEIQQGLDQTSAINEVDGYPEPHVVLRDNGGSDTGSATETDFREGETDRTTEDVHRIDIDDCPEPVEVSLTDRPDYVEDEWPTNITDLERWGVALFDDDRKKTRFPWTKATGEDRFSWSDPRNWGSFDQAQEITEVDPQYECPVYIQGDPEKPYAEEADPYAYIDFDDARNSDSGEVHPYVLETIERAGSYADVSFSGTGVHILVAGTLPDDIGNTIGGKSLPDDERFPDAEIEVYHGARVCYMTGRRIESTPNYIARDDGILKELADQFVDDKDRHEGASELSGYEFTYSKKELSMMESGDYEAVRDAIQRVTPSDIRLKSAKTEDGSRQSWDPCWESSDSGTRLGYDDGVGWIYRKGNQSINALTVVALEERIIHRPHEDLESEDFRDALKELRRRGAHIPELETGAGHGTTDVDREINANDYLLDIGGLGDNPVDCPPTEWDYEQVSRKAFGDDPRTELRKRTTAVIAETMTGRQNTLIEAVPSAGKSYGAIKAAAETGEQISVFTGRGHNEQYEQFKEWALEMGLKPLVLPRFHDVCPTAAGEYGEEWENLVLSWYNRGATGQEIHAYAKRVHGELPPCQHDGECPYSSIWSFDENEYDVLIGHYNHAYLPNVTAGRVCIFDEFPDAYVASTDDFVDYGGNWHRAVTCWLENHPIPYDDFDDLVRNTDDSERRARTLAYIMPGHDDNQNRLENDCSEAISKEDGHAEAAFWVYIVLASTEHTDGVRRSGFPKTRRVGVYNTEHDRITIIKPPEIPNYKPAIALDGTPTRAMWETVLGTRLRHEIVADDDEKAEYIENGLGLRTILTTRGAKPYAGPNITPHIDEKLLEGVIYGHDRKPAVITTKKAVGEWIDHSLIEIDEDSGDVVTGPAKSIKWYGDILGSNEFSSERLGVIVGSNHYGDDFIKEWCAYLDEPFEAESTDEGRQYDGFAATILRHMREHSTLQALLRFGRDGNGATVYVHTNTLPDWVPLAGEMRVSGTWSSGMHQVLDALRDTYEAKETARAKEVEFHSAVDLEHRAVRDKLNQLVEFGILEKRQNPDDARENIYDDPDENLEGSLADIVETASEDGVEFEFDEDITYEPR